MTNKFKDIKEVYPDLKDEDYFYGQSNYDPLVESFGYKTILQVDDSNYQGDSRYLLNDNNKYGLLIIGWGSCSGCDSLQACRSIDQINELRDQIYAGIIWKNSAKEMLDYINTKDWELDYAWHAEETRDFIGKAKSILEGIINDNHLKVGDKEYALNIIHNIILCDGCLDGAGGVCNTPGCILIRCTAPDIAKREEILLLGGLIKRLPEEHND